jgi:hypothetical protein
MKEVTRKALDELEKTDPRRMRALAAVVANFVGFVSKNIIEEGLDESDVIFVVLGSCVKTLRDHLKSEDFKKIMNDLSDMEFEKISEADLKLGPRGIVR